MHKTLCAPPRIAALIAILCLLAPILAQAQKQSRPRARGLGVPLDGTPGPFNAITDVPGVEVGVTTLISGQGRLVVGKGPIRTGVTAILPRGQRSVEPVFAGRFSLNGNGEMTGSHWVDEAGLIEGPIFITNTHSVGTVRDAAVLWMSRLPTAEPWVLPMVAETFDGGLNDALGLHIKKEHVFAALDGSRTGPVPEGNVGGGTGMVCFGFKGGTGTASRKLDAKFGGYTVGVLVQCNAGSRRELRVAGVPVGQEITDLRACLAGEEKPSLPWLKNLPRCEQHSRGPLPAKATAVAPSPREESPFDGQGSIIVVVATDAPLVPHQLARVAKRASLALGRMGGHGEDSSGDLFVAFSTARPGAPNDAGVAPMQSVVGGSVNPLFYATVQATEEAILNAMVAAETLTGADNVRIHALPHDRLREALKKYNRLVDPPSTPPR
ncbi:MAG TPA: P1 family peptidase [Polyangia bacterium]|jgi:L-aminopeptidase/D-esterase-like protein|nr:P1 family peptidase [Polyangia bacterium]